MTETESRILKNQIEIMWALHYLLKQSAPDLVGRGGELDKMCSDLAYESRATKIFADQQHGNKT